jgi:hypothetical protein
LTFNRPFDSGSEQTYPCPEYGNPMTLLSHRFRASKKTGGKKVETKNGVKNYQNYAKYTENIRDAKEFVEQYKNHSRK